MTIKSNEAQVLDQLILVSLSDITSISGRRKLKKEDLGKDAKLPPDVMVSLGSKKIIDPQLINPFTRKKNTAHTLCQEVGIRFMGGYAVPADKINDLIAKLNVLKSDFYAYKAEFMKADFKSWINSFEEKYRDILLRDASIDLHYMDNQIQFGFTAIHITPYSNSIIQGSLTGQIKSLADEVYEDVANVVEGFLKNRNPDSFSQHTLNPLRRCAEKLDSLSFIAPCVKGLCKYVSDMLKDIPLTGKITGKHYNDILSLLNNLRDPQNAKSFVELLSQPQSNAATDTTVDLTMLNVLDYTAQPVPALAVDNNNAVDETSPALVHVDAFASAVVVSDEEFDDLPTDLPTVGLVTDPVVDVETVVTVVAEEATLTPVENVLAEIASSVVVVDDSSFLSGVSDAPYSLPDASEIERTPAASKEPVSIQTLNFADKDDGLFVF
ncbi:MULTISPECIES: DUF3150 domain-containing protein [Photorhabdus]|uniref:DUF3150 domain-containing protein n=2 Tax=Photorhabdus TaxID=29487 RepID=A0AAW6BNS7_9GAMM|nr:MULTISPECIES: DUF3150 domain-containing protein [Photorhabdus]EYU13385.1 Protein of unknown function (DUF3150) [Photorhabdus aegyptia]MDB6375077.1 DUF3150 domain-containing protein [Photorhabdus bodei]